MRFNLLKYRIIKLRKLKTTYDLQQEFINIQQEWDIQLTERKAEYIYKDKRLFRKMLESSSKATLLCQLAICLSYKNALQLIKSQEFSEALISYRDAKEWLEKVDRKHYKVDISEECQKLWKQVEKQGVLSEKNSLANGVSKALRPKPLVNHFRCSPSLGGAKELMMDSSYVPCKGGVDGSHNESMQASNKSIDLLLEEKRREWRRNHSYLEEMHKRHIVWLPPSFGSKR